MTLKELKQSLEKIGGPFEDFQLMIRTDKGMCHVQEELEIHLQVKRIVLKTR